MQAILPGKPQAQLQAACTGSWEGQLVVAYISGNAIVICNAPDCLLQTIYHDDLTEDGLVAITYHNESGKIAVASTTTVYVYALREEIKGDLRWSFHLSLPLPGDDDKKDQIRTLSWGSDEELLVGSRKLTLFSTHLPSSPSSPDQTSTGKSKTKSEQLVWTKALPSPVTQAAFSPSTSLLATTSLHDRLVKIWRRLSLEPPSFDYTYLPHPTTVTHLEWRPTASGFVGDEDVLYTTCADGKLRVWKADAPHNIEILSLHAELDMFKVIQPKDTPSNESIQRRYSFLIPSHVFNAAAAHVLEGEFQRAESRHALEYLKELASREPDVAVVMDDQGHMSAWGLENVACKRRNSIVARSDFFHAAHIEDASLAFEPADTPFEDNASIYCFSIPESPGEIAILLHHFDGRIQWWQASIQRLFSPSPRSHPMRNLANWTGHSSAIKKAIRTASGKALISRTVRDETIVWERKATKAGTALHRRSKAKLDEHIHRTILLRDGDFVVFLHHESLSLWDARCSLLIETARCKYEIEGKPIAFLILPQADVSNAIMHLATVSTSMHGIVWELHLPSPDSQQNGYTSKTTSAVSLRQFCTFQLDPIDNLSYFLPVDPAGSGPAISGFLDSFAQDTAISWTSTGLLQTWTAKIDPVRSSVDWLNLAKVETGVREPSLGSGTSIRKAALVDKSRSTLTIWDTRNGRLDYEETFPNQIIQDLDWASTPDNQSILAIGFAHSVFVYTQLRYDYVDERPAWTRIKEVGIRHLTPHPIGDSVWLGSGNLVVGTGTQLFVVSSAINPKTDLSPDLRASAPHKPSDNIHDVVRALNGPLPVFHPQFISQCVLAGKMNMVHRILLALHKTLKFYTEGEPLDSFQGTSIDDYMANPEDDANGAARPHKRYNVLEPDDDEPATVTEDVSVALTSLLAEKSIPQLSSTEQFGLAVMVECIGEVEKHRRSIDENAARFLLFWRGALARSRQSHSRQHDPTVSGSSITWREMVWAYHSSSHDILVATITSHYKGRLEWSHAKGTGMFMWLTDREALLAQFEAIARNAYTSSEPKNPVDCSLYYLALRKKAVLQGLWRIATWSREQGATTRLLKNDFSDPRWKTAAAKNAYALMGKRRFEYAAAFFLLGDDLKSAIGVLSNQLGDTQLAIAVARVYGGDDSPILKTFLQIKVLPAAVQAGDRWQATWCYWLLGQRSLAVRALVSPLHSLLDPPSTPAKSLRAKSFLNDDPALVVLYKQLREKSLQTLKGALMITGREEWDFITKTANLLLRMGCDVLALDLVRNWEFLQQQVPRPTDGEREESVAELPGCVSNRSSLQDYEMDPRKLLRRRSSMVVADLPETLRSTVSRTQSSILDGWNEPTSNKQDTPIVPSMLDGWGEPAATSQKAPVRSALDDWGIGPEPVASGAAPKSMLDDWDSSARSITSASTTVQGQGANRKDDSTDTTSSATSEAKDKNSNGKKDDDNKPPPPPPTQFNEPDPNSLLDSFGF
ncbi:hypothetical protein AAFC00_004283 [Neodothiora populina]|uniref:RAVE complex protein Rav1 C-terminal domain-containing protein n=1 Tax=Neodothiora populina TaxID=2781224 RepID=A0ABR3PJ57_9PEZI